MAKNSIESILWDLPDDPTGNVAHVLEHGLSVEDVEDVRLNPENIIRTSRSSGRPVTFGFTSDGRYIAVVWELIGKIPYTVRPITAYEVPEPD
jgi:uncharacterized DUF497 family protein